jgi:hypothetical protein
MKHFTFVYALQKRWHTDRVLVFQETTYLIVLHVNERILWTLLLMPDDPLYYGMLQFLLQITAPFVMFRTIFLYCIVL